MKRFLFAVAVCLTLGLVGTSAQAGNYFHTGHVSNSHGHYAHSSHGHVNQHVHYAPSHTHVTPSHVHVPQQHVHVPTYTPVYQAPYYPAPTYQNHYHTQPMHYDYAPIYTPHCTTNYSHCD